MQKPVRLQSDSKWSIHRSRCKAVSTWIETTTNGNVESFKKMNPKRTCLNTTTWLLYHTGQIVQIFFFNLKKQNKKKNTPDVYAASAAASQSFIALNQVDSKCLQSSCLSLTCQDKIRIRPKQIYSNLFVNLWSHLQRMTKKKTKRDVFH